MTGKEIGAVSLVMLEATERHIGSLPVAVLTSPPQVVQKYWRGAKEKKSESLELTMSEDGHD